MQRNIQQRERKIVPRFRRKNENRNNVDIDDEEADALIQKDLQSHFKWTSDTNEELKYQFDNYQHENNSQQISFDDQINQEFIYDLENNNQQLWNINIQDNENHLIKWTHDQQQQQISLNIHSIKDQQQQWSLQDLNHQSIQFNLIHQDDLLYKHDLDTINHNQQTNFIEGDEFIHKMKFGIESSNEEINSFPNDGEDNKTISFDSNIPSIDSKLSLPQAPIIIEWIEGISQYRLSLPVDKLSEEYSPLSEMKVQFDSNSLKYLKWSLDLLKENLIYTYLISFPDNSQNHYSIPDIFNLKLSIDDENNKQLYSLNDISSKQTISLSSNDIKQQLLSIIDLIEIKQNFGCDDQLLFHQFCLKDFKNLIFNLSPEEILNYIYSPNDAKQILLENLLIESDEISTRAFRRYRCKHMSIKTDEKDQLDSQQGLNLQFKGNELIAIGEQQISNDLDQQQIYKDVTNCEILLQDNLLQSYDITTSDSSPSNLGPCLFRSDYERQPPSTWTRLRREIGYISYDASLTQPTYHLDKSFKRFVHIPTKREKCSYDVYKGYDEFMEKVRLDSSNYFRPFDATDLRPLLHWYSNKQNLFSSNNKSLLKPPTFICRRLVLRTILANLYCDSDPWKLLVLRIKGQFYLSLANKQTKRVEHMTKDEYSGYKFEDLFTTEQPNTTRFNEKIPLEKPQQQFHTVQYWQFGEFNILYSNEIDGEIKDNNQQKPTTTETTNPVKQGDDTTKQTSTDNSESKQPEADRWNYEPSSQIEIPSDTSTQIETLPDVSSQIETTGEEIEDESKQAQINENLELIKNDENEVVEKKKRFDNEPKVGYVEMKCTNKKIFYRDENKLQTLHWWAQMWLANINTLMIGYKSSNDGIIDQLDLFSIHQLISKFLSKYDLHLKYCLSYLYSFLQLIQKTVHIDDPNTIHAFAYIPQPLEMDPLTGKPLQVDLPKCVPFRYTQIKRSNQRHQNFIPDWYLQDIQRTIPVGGILQDNQCKTVEQEMKKRLSHRGRSSCILKQQQKQDQRQRKKHK